MQQNINRPPPLTIEPGLIRHHTPVARCPPCRPAASCSALTASFPAHQFRSSVSRCRDSAVPLLVKMKRLRRSRCHRSPQRRNRRRPSRMDRVRQNHNERIAIRIHPQRRPGKSRMAKTANRKHLTPRPRKRRIDIPPKPSCGNARRRLSIRRKDRRPADRGCRLFRLRHQLQRRLLQRKITWPSRQPIQQSLRKQRHIARRRKYPRMPRNPTHPPRRRIMHRAAQQMVVVRIRLRRPLIVMRVGAVFHAHSFASQSPLRQLHCSFDTNVVEGKTVIHDRIADGLVRPARLINRQIPRMRHLQWREDMLAPHTHPASRR